MDIPFIFWGQISGIDNQFCWCWNSQIVFIVSGQVLQEEPRLHGLRETRGCPGHRRVSVSVPTETVELLLHAGRHQQPDQPDQGSPRWQEALPVKPGGDAAQWAAGPSQQLRLLCTLEDVRPAANHQRHVKLLHLQGRQEGGKEQQERPEERQRETEQERLVSLIIINILLCLIRRKISF